MQEQMRYEFKKHKPAFQRLLGMTLAVNSLFLLFFSLVGRWETADADALLTDVVGVMALATTVTIAVTVIYGVVLCNRLVLKRYIGQARERSYLFPEGRQTIVLSKLWAVSAHYLKQVLSILLVEGVTFYLIGDRLGLVRSDALGGLLQVVGLGLVAGFFSLGLVLMSILIGQVAQSTTAALLTAVVMVSVAGNVMAHLYVLPYVMLMALAGLAMVLVYWLIQLFVARVKRDDIIGN